MPKQTHEMRITKLERNIGSLKRKIKKIEGKQKGYEQITLIGGIVGGVAGGIFLLQIIWEGIKLIATFFGL